MSSSLLQSGVDPSKTLYAYSLSVGSGGVKGAVLNTGLITANTNLTAAQSGTLFTLNPAANTTINLPAVAPSLYFRFTLQAKTAFGLTISAPAQILFGTCVEPTGVGAAYSEIACGAAGKTSVTFGTNTATQGDYLEVFSNAAGTAWIIQGHTNENGGLILA